ncbi:ribosylnicotinamide kinase [Lithohypha guttulata]|uniref:ribosylnicotinamide kinase n=1 Tax=Lithohypha guttulata TaxID=1690604 RepID=UPI002DE15037|nr:ribosylnicotinamide kinase [Lithohypha guttulata]
MPPHALPKSPPSTSTSSKTTFIIGLSGPSSSGKTTLARLLRQIFNINPGSSNRTSPLRLFILHEDDFYKTDKLIPRDTFTSAEHGERELDDWDCVESIDLPLLKRVLGHVKRCGVGPDDFASKEDQNTVGESGVDEGEVREYQGRVREWVDTLNMGLDSGAGAINGTATVNEKELYEILDPLLDLKLFLPSSRQKTIERRTKRTGYVTLEGFWADPPGYVEDVVWPNYARDHAWLFDGGDGDGSEASRQQAIDDGRVDRDVAARHGVHIGPGSGDVHLREILPWAIEKIRVVLGQAAT